MSKRFFQYADGSIRDFHKREYTNAITINDGEINEIIQKARAMAARIRSLSNGMIGRPGVPELGEIFAILEAANCPRCGGSGKIMDKQGSHQLSTCDSCGGTGWYPVEGDTTYTVGIPPDIKFADAFHATLTRGNTLLELRMVFTGKDGEVASVPCKVVRNREKFTFESEPITISMTMVMAQVLDQFDQMIVTREETMVIERGYSVTLQFEAAAV